MGTGKSVIAREISRILGFPHFETDEMVVDKEGMTIPEIFDLHGEAYFREVEHSVLHDILLRQQTGAVISTGGGVPTHIPNQELLAELGYVVWLYTSEEETFKRVSGNKDRPLLSEGDLQRKIHDMMAERSPIYHQVSHTKIDTGGLNVFEIATGIIDSASYYYSKNGVEDEM